MSKKIIGIISGIIAVTVGIYIATNIVWADNPPLYTVLWFIYVLSVATLTQTMMLIQAKPRNSEEKKKRIEEP